MSDRVPSPSGSITAGSPWRRTGRGRFELSVVESQVLRDNPLGDPWARPIEVYLPPGYDDQPERRYPSVYIIQGYSGQLDMWPTGAPSGPTSPSSATRSSAVRARRHRRWWSSSTAGRRWGAASSWNSPAMGRYHTHLCEEVVPWVDGRYRPSPPPLTAASPASRAADTGRWSPACSAPTSSGGSPTTPGTPSSRTATCPTSAGAPASSATTTRVRTRASARTSAPGRR